MTLRKYRRIGQLAVGAVFANRTERRWASNASADGNKYGGPAQLIEKDSCGLFVLGVAGSTPSAVSLQGHDMQALHNVELDAVSSC